MKQIAKFAGMASLLISSLGNAASLNASKIIATGESTLRGRSTQAVLSMKIVRPDFTRELKVRAWTAGDNRALVEILEPAKEEGVVSLRNTNQMWNYLPKTDQVVRVPTSLMLQSWMGSDFTNDDLMKASSLLRDYHHRILRTLTVHGEKVVQIECIPKPNAPVVWGKVLYWARLKDSLPVMQKFFDDGGRWVRTLTFSKFQRMDDRVVPAIIRVTKADEPKEFTIVKYQQILYDRKIESQIFDKEGIRRVSYQGKAMKWGWFQTPLKKNAVYAGVVR
jgi:outer membrane lipoprotein-sorting protein